MPEADELPPRESMEYDVVIVGAGPAGLAAAIRLKQQDANRSVVVVEKGSAVGAHILSGAVIDPIGFDRLIPDWRADPECPLKTQVSKDRFHYLSATRSVRLPNWPMPPLMSNHGNFVGSLGAVARWLGARAEALGVEIYPGFAATELLYGEKGQVVGIATGDMGIGRDGKPKPSFTRGMELRGKYVLLAEGARGSLAKVAIARFDLEKESLPQKFGIGLKELWRIQADKFSPGLVQHTFGWPLTSGATGGSFHYHYDDRLVSIGFVVHLSYNNPYLSPFDEFQRFKTHPLIRNVLTGGERLGYGARALTSGGWYSVPKLVFPGGALIGCAAGFVNFARIKGAHNAILSGMLAAEAVEEALGAGRANDELMAYESAWRASDIGRDLYKVRNVKALWSRFGLAVGVSLGGFDMWTHQLFGGSLFGSLKLAKPDSATLKPIAEARPIAYPKPDGVLTFDKHSSVFLSNIARKLAKPDSATLKPIAEAKPIAYPKPDGVLTFDKLSSVFLSNTNHEEDQPIHLRLIDPTIPIKENLPRYGEPARLYCPAAVYEVAYDDEKTSSGPRFVINASNCVHCKTCDIKDPAQNIVWTPPEGGGGPNYSDM